MELIKKKRKSLILLIVIVILLSGCDLLDVFLDSEEPTPENLTASEEYSDQIELEWTRDAIRHDDYIIERGSTLNGPWTRYYVSETGTFTDTEVTPDNTYYYRIARANVSGEKVSSWSSLVIGKTVNHDDSDDHDGTNDGDNPSPEIPVYENTSLPMLSESFVYQEFLKTGEGDSFYESSTLEVWTADEDIGKKEGGEFSGNINGLKIEGVYDLDSLTEPVKLVVPVDVAGRYISIYIAGKKIFVDAIEYLDESKTVIGSIYMGEEEVAEQSSSIANIDDFYSSQNLVNLSQPDGEGRFIGRSDWYSRIGVSYSKSTEVKFIRFSLASWDKSLFFKASDYIDFVEGKGIKYRVTDEYNNLDCNVWAISQKVPGDYSTDYNHIITLVKNGTDGGYFRNSTLGSAWKENGDFNYFNIYSGIGVGNQAHFYFDLHQMKQNMKAEENYEIDNCGSFTVKDGDSVTINGVTFDNCLKIEYVSDIDGDDYTNGSGYAIFAPDMGLVKLEFTRSESDEPYGNCKVVYEFLEAQSFIDNEISGTITSDGITPVSDLHVQIASSILDSTSKTDASGYYTLPNIYGPDIHLRLGYNGNDENDENLDFDFPDNTYPKEVTINGVSSDIVDADFDLSSL